MTGAIARLAASRIRHNRSQTILTGIAFVLTTCLLTAVACMGYGIYGMNKQSALESTQNHHATFADVTPAQLEALSLHLDVESLTATEVFASVVKDKMNGTLRCGETLLPGVKDIAVLEGRLPAGLDEITGPPAFFERLGYPDPALGDTVEVSYRVLGKGEVVIRPFVITGLMEQVDMSQYSIADTRIAYSARISKALTDEALAGGERFYRVQVRVKGEDSLRLYQIEELINRVADDVGVPEIDRDVNSAYLMWVTDPGTEFIVVVSAICALIALFAVLVIYSIYYVSVITNVQELGKLKALGATRGQMKGLLLREGLLVAALAIPLGLLLGYLTARGCVHILVTRFWPQMLRGEVALVSWPALAAVVALVLLTAVLSLLGPMRQVAKISPIEAIRYQEKSVGRRASRKGYDFLNLGRLSAANMNRNRRRTAVTILTMALGGVLFLSIAGIASSMDELDYARKHHTKGEFIVDLRYSGNDETYPENNLNALQQTDIMGAGTKEAITSLPGVTRVEKGQGALAKIHHPGYEEGTRYSLEDFTREDLSAMEVKRGQLDYDALVAGNGIVFSRDVFLDYTGLAIGDTVQMTLLDGDREVPFEGVLMASTQTGNGEFAIPREVLDKYITDTDATLRFYVWTEGGLEGAAYPQVKAGLKELVDPSLNLSIMSLDEEMEIARTSMQATTIALYMILGILGVVSFMNLINTLVTSVITRRREIGTLQAIGLSNRQLGAMLRREGLTFTAGTLLCALTIGNGLGYLGFLWAKDSGLMGITHYHYPLAETIVMVAALVAGQLVVTRLLSRYAHKESLVQRIQL